jgi:pimeloyl-ACP methyl ester carboxylesterase
MTRTHARRLFAVATLVSFALAAPTTGSAQVQSSEQQTCASGAEKSLQKIVKAYGKDVSSCLKAVAKGSTTASSCFGSDPKGKVKKARQGVIDSYADGCIGSRTDFAFAGADSVLTATDDTDARMVEALFGDDPSVPLPTGNPDTAMVKCQQGVAKSIQKCSGAQLKSYAKCEATQLQDGATSSTAVVPCFGADDQGKIAKSCDLNADGKVDAIRGAIAKSCSGVDLSVAFPGCGTADAEQLHGCLAAAMRCEACRQVGETSALEASLDCDDYDDATANGSCVAIFWENVSIPNSVEPAETPGSPSVVVTNPLLLTQFGGPTFSLNNSIYTRWRLTGPEQQPDAIMIAIAGFGGDANNFKIMAEDLIPKMLADHGLVVEVWGYHRRSDPLEDREGALLGADAADPLVALDWYYGTELGLAPHPLLSTGPNRRSVFYNTSSDIPFLANWTTHVFSRDIDVIVETAQATASNGNVFVAGHSAGTGFTARYAATDFDLSGMGPAEPGYEKLRGLILFEGGGGNTTGAPLTSDSLDRIEDKFDGGLFAAVRDNAPRCTDGTPCTVATEAADCAGKGNEKCTEPVTAYSAVGGITPAITASSEPTAIQGLNDADVGTAIIQVDQGMGSAVDVVPALSLLGLLPQCTVEGIYGSFLDDDGLGAALSPALATSLGAPGNGIPQRWTAIEDAPMPGSVLPNNGPAPVAATPAVWGQEKELVSMTRFRSMFLAADTNAADWYFAASGLGLTSSLGRCNVGSCTAGNVGALCSTNAECAQSISLDSSALSVGRGRDDIVNLTQAGNIDIPVISFGGSNGLTPIGASYLGFANSIATCTAPSCDGTPRVVNASSPSAAFPTYGDVDGGYEVYIREGLAHQDVLQAQDGPDSNVLTPLAAFIARNVQ